MEKDSLPAWHSYVFAGTHGHVVALHQSSGEQVWKTSLPSTGYDVVAMLVENQRLLCASAGRVFALDPSTGEILWTNELPGMGMGHVFLTTASSNQSEKVLSILAAATSHQAAT